MIQVANITIMYDFSYTHYAKKYSKDSKVIKGKCFPQNQTLDLIMSMFVTLITYMLFAT